MNKIRWFFMSKYKKLLYNIKIANENEQRLHLKNGVVLDFANGKYDWNDYCRNLSYFEIGKYYLITRCFPTGNRKMELVKVDEEKMILPEFTTHYMKLDIKPCKTRY